nr:flavin reductase [Arthrobacter sp. OV608]
MTPDQFRAAFRNHPGGVAVVTADAGDGPVGLTATYVISASVEPNMLAFSVSELSSSTPTIRLASTTAHRPAGRSCLPAAPCST